MDHVKLSIAIPEIAEDGRLLKSNAISIIFLKSFIAGVLLSYATTLAYTTTTQTNLDLVGAIVFPSGFLIITLFGLELVTGGFAKLPITYYYRKISIPKMLKLLIWLFLGNLIGALFYAFLYTYYVSYSSGTDLLIDKIISVAEQKTIHYKVAGKEGILVLLIKAFLCNWMVTMGVVLGYCSRTTIGKIGAVWLPIFIFFAQGYEHSVVNMFVIPAGILLGAEVTLMDWWLWNQIPVTVANFISGAIFTGLFFFYIVYIPTKK